MGGERGERGVACPPQVDAKRAPHTKKKRLPRGRPLLGGPHHARVHAPSRFPDPPQARGLAASAQAGRGRAHAPHTQRTRWAFRVGGSAAGGECVLLAAPPFDFPSQRTCVLRGGQGALARSVRYTASPDNWGGSWTAARGGEGTPPAGQGLPLFYWHTRRPHGRRGRGLCPAPALSPVSAQPLPSTQASPTSHRPRARLTDGWPTMTEVRQGWRRGDGGRGGDR